MNHDIDDLDGVLRTMMRTVVAETPTSPAVEEISRPALTMVHEVDGPRRRPVMIVAVLAVAAALIIAVLAVGHLRNGRRSGQQPPAASPTTTPTSNRLSGYIMPTVVPEGWKLMDVTELPGVGGNSFRGAGQLFRRQDDGAAVSITIAASASAAGDSSAPAATAATAAPLTTLATANGGVIVGRSAAIFADNRTSFNESDADVVVEIAGLTAADAIGFLRALEPSGLGAGLRYRLPLGSAFVLESSADAKLPAPDVDPTGALTYAGQYGQAFSMQVWDNKPGDQTFVRFGVPTIVNGVTLYVNSWAVQRQFDDGTDAGASYRGDESRAAAEQALASATPVDRSAWVQASADVNTRLGALPVLSTVQIGDVTITRRQDASTSAACAQRGGQTSCQIEAGSIWGVEGSFEVDITVDEAWVHIGYATDFRPTVRFTGKLDHGVAQTAWVPDGEGSLYAFVMPSDASKLTVDVGDTDRGSGGDGAVRPLL